MKKYLLVSLAAIAAVLCCVSLSLGAEVAQGKMRKNRKGRDVGHDRRIRYSVQQGASYGRSTGKTSVYNFSKAEVGVPAAWAMFCALPLW